MAKDISDVIIMCRDKGIIPYNIFDLGQVPADTEERAFNIVERYYEV